MEKIKTKKPKQSIRPQQKVELSFLTNILKAEQVKDVKLKDF